jgi:ribose transport system permease protein
MSQSTFMRILRRPPGITSVSAIYLLVVILVVFSIWIPTSFLQSITFQLVASDQVVTGMVALALLIPLVAGAFDLSAGAMVGFSLSIVSWFAQSTHVNPVIACVVAVVACALVGAISGLIVVYLRVDSFIATLGMSQILAAAALLVSNNQTISGVFSNSFLDFATNEVFGLQLGVYYLVAVALIAWYVMERTGLGRRMFATGANPEAARLAGVRTDRLVFGSLIASAVVAAFGGIVYGAQIGSFSNTFGQPLLFPGFAAVFFGATQIKSRPNVWGTILALYTLAFGVKGIQLAFSSGVYWITPLFNGVALVIAVALARRKVAAAKRRKSISEVAGPSPDELDAAHSEQPAPT